MKAFLVRVTVGCLFLIVVAACQTGGEQAAPPTATPQPAVVAQPSTPTGAPATRLAATATPAPTAGSASATSVVTADAPRALAAPPTAPALSPLLEGPALLAALRRGGLVLYFRHAATDFAQTDSDLQNLDNCQTQRNLSEQGKADSAAIGQAFRDLGIPVGTVRASAYCRTREMAQLAFGRAEVAPEITSRPAAANQAEYERRVAALRQMFGTAPAPGTNTVLVAHQWNMQDAAAITLAEGEAAIFEPQPGGGYRLVGRVRPDGWPKLAPAAATSPAARPTAVPKDQLTLQEFPVPAGAHPHDVAPAPDGTVWYTAQYQGALGRLDPKTGQTRQILLGRGSSPHGVIVGPDGAAWVTDSGLNAIVRVDPGTEEIKTFPLPANKPNANLNTATFDGKGVLWFTGQNGVYGRLDPAVGQVEVFDAPRGRGPYGIATTPQGDVYYASLAGSHIARIDTTTGAATVIEPPTPSQGARRVWSDSRGMIWVSEWNSGQVSRYDPATGTWRQWKAPGERPAIYAVYVDESDMVWLTDFNANAMLRFDPTTEKFDSFPHPQSPASVRQLLGRPGEVWGAMSGLDRLVVVKRK